MVGVLHHIVTDWWSYYVFYSELLGLYHAFSNGLPNQLPDLPIQYADWASWRDQWEQTSDFRKQEGYWLRQLQDVPHVLEVPADRARPAVQSHGGARSPFDVPNDTLRRLRAMNRQAGTSSFMTLLAALDVFLWRYTGQEDFVVGTPVSADRDSEETANLIGYMLNTLVLRADLSGNPTFLEVLDRVRTTCLDAFAHKEYPFRHLVDKLKVERDMSRMPLYQVEYLYISTESPVQATAGMPEGEISLPGFEFTVFGIDRKTSPVDLQITFGESKDQLSLMFEYNTDIFEPRTIDRLASHLITLLDSLLCTPGQKITNFHLLSPAERQHIIYGLNPETTECKHERAITRFESQAARTPDAIALRFGEELLRFNELNQRTNRLAHHLIKQGAGPEKIVAICIERSPEMLIAILAVLKSGAAYLPLDPGFPEERLSYMVSDAAPVAVLTRESLKFARPVDVHQICLGSSDFASILERESASNPHPEEFQQLPSSANPAYVIYTSGSTGRPKGVLVSHEALSAFIAALDKQQILSPGKAHLAITTIGFDISILELLVPLCSGGQVILASQEEGRDAAQLCRLLASSDVDSMQATPSHWEMLLRESPACLENLQILSGGEALPRQLAAQLLQVTDREVLNLYGPTEATIWSNIHRLQSSDVTEQSPAVITIGKPLSGYSIYVLDHCLESTPINVAGDLYIGGRALARGYLNRPALTSEPFVADPFRPSGSRMYRTGDLARWREDGTLEFLGRADEQIKLRGFRIELGEIEAVLKSQPDISQAAVIMREDSGTGKELVAYLVPTDGQVPELPQLRHKLSERLPDYMLPSAIVMMEALPLTPNGKLNRRALPAPERQRAVYTAPRTPEEEALCHIFSEVLGLENIGVKDNFFSLGGHSLTATRVVSQIRTVLGIDLPLKKLFEAPTVADLAPYLSHAEKAPLQLGPQLRPERLPLSNSQQRLWFIDQLEGSSTQYNLPEALRLRGPLDLPALRKALARMVERHETLRTRFAYIDGKPVQIIEAQLEVLCPVDDLSVLSRDKQRERIVEALNQEFSKSFDLSQVPLFRMKLFKLGEHDHVFLRTLHHIISDGWSQGVFNNELMQLYKAISGGHPDPLKPLALQYADYALWQQQWLSKEKVQTDLEYWRKQLSGIPEQLDLPKDHPRQARRTYAADVYTVSLPKATRSELEKLSGANGA